MSSFRFRDWSVRTICLFLSCAVAPAFAQTYNVAADFSTTSNPAGVWSYGYEATLGSSYFTKYTDKGNFSNIDFCFLSGTGLPDVGKNNTTSTQVFLPPGDVMLHPGNTAALASYASVIRWTAPSTNQFDVSTLFTGIDNRNPDVKVYVFHDASADFSGVVSGTGATQAYDRRYSLAAGETLDFVVGNDGAVGDRNFTQLDATISAVPEAKQRPSVIP
jgi:hypothetical protein